MNWLMEKFNLDLSLVSQLGASSLQAFDLVRFNIPDDPTPKKPSNPRRRRRAIFLFFRVGFFVVRRSSRVARTAF